MALTRYLAEKREAHRAANGEFGEQHRSAPDVSLAPSRMPDAASIFEGRITGAWEMTPVELARVSIDELAASDDSKLPEVQGMMQRLERRVAAFDEAHQHTSNVIGGQLRTHKAVPTTVKRPGQSDVKSFRQDFDEAFYDVKTRVRAGMTAEDIYVELLRAEAFSSRRVTTRPPDGTLAHIAETTAEHHGLDDGVERDGVERTVRLAAAEAYLPRKDAEAAEQRAWRTAQGLVGEHPLLVYGTLVMEARAT